VVDRLMRRDWLTAHRESWFPLRQPASRSTRLATRASGDAWLDPANDKGGADATPDPRRSRCDAGGRALLAASGVCGGRRGLSRQPGSPERIGRAPGKARSTPGEDWSIPSETPDGAVRSRCPSRCASRMSCCGATALPRRVHRREPRSELCSQRCRRTGTWRLPPQPAALLIVQLRYLSPVLRGYDG
jgi:hypothetical protein